MLVVEFFIIGLIIIVGFVWQIRLFRKDIRRMDYSSRYYFPPILGVIIFIGMIGHAFINQSSFFINSNDFITVSYNLLLLTLVFWTKAIFGSLVGTFALCNLSHYMFNYGEIEFQETYIFISKIVVPELSEPYQLIYMCLFFIISIGSSVWDYID